MDEKLFNYKDKIDELRRNFDVNQLQQMKDELKALGDEYENDYYYFYLLGLCCEGMVCVYFQTKENDKLAKTSDEGKVYLNTALKLKEDFFEAHRSLGQTAGYATMADPFSLMKNVSIVEKEIKIAKKFIKTDLDQYRYTLWQCYKMIATPSLFGGNPQEAFDTLEELFKNNGNDDLIPALQGLACNALKEKEKAQLYFKKSLKLNANNLMAKVNLGG